MRLAPVLAAVRAQLGSHIGIAGGDPQIEAAAAQLIEALDPALRHAVTQIAQQAAAEIEAQLTDHVVSVVLDGDDIELRVGERLRPPVVSIDEELDARITLRLPPSLKKTIERFATVDGESVNAWVVDALSKRATRSDAAGHRLTDEFDI